MAWHSTYYALQLTAPDPDGNVLVPTFGIFSDIDKAQGEADKWTKNCSAGYKYEVIPVTVTAIEPAFTANEMREAFHAKN